MLVGNGESGFSVQPKAVQEVINKSAEKDGGLSIPAWPADAFGVTNQTDISWVNARLTAHPMRTFTQPLVLHHPYGNHLPLIYISCTVNQLPAIVPYAEKAKNSKDWKYYAIETGHDAMITEPVKTAALLESFK